MQIFIEGCILPQKHQTLQKPATRAVKLIRFQQSESRILHPLRIRNLTTLPCKRKLPISVHHVSTVQSISVRRLRCLKSF